MNIDRKKFNEGFNYILSLDGVDQYFKTYHKANKMAKKLSYKNNLTIYNLVNGKREAKSVTVRLQNLK